MNKYRKKARRYNDVAAQFVAEFQHLGPLQGQLEEAESRKKQLSTVVQQACAALKDLEATLCRARALKINSAEAQDIIKGKQSERKTLAIKLAVVATDAASRRKESDRL